MRYKYFFILINLLFLNCQQQKIEKSNHLDKKDTVDFIENASIDNVTTFLFNISQKEPKKITTYNLLFLKRGKRIKNDTIKYISYYYLSQSNHYQSSNFRNATLYADSAFIAATNLESPIKIIRALNLKGISQFENADYEDALKSYMDAKKMSEDFNLYEEEVYSMGHIGHIKKVLKEYQEGIEIYNELLLLLKSKEYKQIDSYNGSYINAINLLGICHREIGNTEESIKLFKEGISMIDNLELQNFNRDRAMLLSNMSKSYIDQDLYDVALDNLNIAQDILLTHNIPINQNYFYMRLNFAKALEGKQNYDEALLNIEKAFIEAKDEIYSEVFLEISDLGVDLANKIKNKNKELKFSRLRNKISDVIHTENVQTRRLINNELSEENNELLNDNKTKLKKIGEAKLLVILLIGSLLVIIILYIYNNIKNQKKFKLLLHKIEHTKEVASTLIISDEKANKILVQLKKLEDKEFFLQKSCSLHKTAAKLKTNTSYLSKIINSYKKKTFKEYINELRIEFVLNQIKDNSRFRLYTIKAIAEETGYKSVNTLNQAFKKQTQLTLSYYLKQFSKQP